MAIDLPTVIQILHLTSFFKVAVLVTLGSFLIFLFVVYKQVHALNQTIRQTTYGTLIEFVAVLLILAVVVLFLISVAIL
jgi:hypothetical protein